MVLQPANVQAQGRSVATLQATAVRTSVGGLLEAIAGGGKGRSQGSIAATCMPSVNSVCCKLNFNQLASHSIYQGLQFAITC